MGFFKIDRKLFDHWLWERKPFSEGQAWIDLIGLANYENGKTVYDGQLINCERGTVYRSCVYLADRWGWSRKKVRRFLSRLEADQMVVVNGTTHGTTILLVRYSFFQGQGPTNDPTDAQMLADRCPNVAHGKKKNKEIKKNKNSSSCPPGLASPEAAKEKEEAAQAIAQAWNTLPDVPPVKAITAHRLAMVSELLGQFRQEQVLEAIKSIRGNPLYTGSNPSGWRISFDWLLKPDNFVKVLEGRFYESKTAAKGGEQFSVDWIADLDEKEGPK